MSPLATPTEVFWHVVANAGIVPWVFKALCAACGVVAVYRLERQWEHIPLFFGLILVGVSPLWTPAGPFGDWLVYPSLVVVLWRHAAHRCVVIDPRRWRGLSADTRRAAVKAVRDKRQRTPFAG